MKVLLLSDTYSEHTEKWALSLANRSIHIGIFSFNKAAYDWYNHPNITIFFEPESKINAESTVTKLAYLKYVSILKKIIRHFQPDILHAHYATSYGLVGALSGFHPYVISSWGSDVMKFPNKNIVAKSILKYNFRQADLLCATSNVIKEYITRIIPRDVAVVPFGIDTERFKPAKEVSVFGDGHVVIGCIKSLESIYKIDVLLRAFYQVSKKQENARLLIIGEGSQENKLKLLATELELGKKVMFTGRVPYHEIPYHYNMLDVLVNISEYESFGVSVVEAMSCGVPVVVSDVGGLAEIVKSEEFGLKVKVNDIEGTAAAIERLIEDHSLYRSFSEKGRAHVMEKYNWKENLDEMIQLYEKLLHDSKASKKKERKTS